jgi:hypothetical protein
LSESAANSVPESAENEAAGFPDPVEVLREAQQSEDYPSGPVNRVEINTLESGQATWRVWEPGADEAIGGFYAGPF